MCSLSCQRKGLRWLSPCQIVYQPNELKKTTGMFGNIMTSCCHRNNEKMKQSHYPNISLEILTLNRQLDSFSPLLLPLHLTGL